MRNTRWIYRNKSNLQSSNLNFDKRDILNLLISRDIVDEEKRYTTL